LGITNIRNRIRAALVSDRRFLERRYKREIGVPLDLANPRRMTALLNWQKLYDHNPLYVRCADKLAVRSFVEERSGAEILVPLLASGGKWSDLDYSSLAEPFIIKTTHGQGANKIVLDKSVEDEAELRRFFARHLRRNHYSRLREWQYKDIKPALIVERLLLDEDGRIPTDYKFHCFHTDDGPDIIVNVLSRQDGEKRGANFDVSWKHLPFEAAVPMPDELPSRPPFLAELIQIAERLAAGFTYVRVDLYWVRGRAFFGELTFTPSSGLRRIEPDEWDFILGEKLLKAGILEKAQRPT
jgi:hypothetical protein